MKSLPAFLVLVAPLVAAMAAGCADKHHDVYGGEIDPESFATMTTTDVNTVISDSGIKRYRILAPIWLVYDEAAEPTWRFKLGMHMERYDNTGKVNATVDCDSAIYYTGLDLWELIGAVDIHSSDGQRFLTEQLYWNRRTREVYTDSFIHIRRPDRVLEGYGLRSNDEFTNYVIPRPTGSFPVSQFSPDGDGGTTGRNASSGDPYDPRLAAQSDPDDAVRTDEAFNGVPTDTTFVSTSPSAPRRVRPVRIPRVRPDSLVIAPTQ